MGRVNYGHKLLADSQRRAFAQVSVWICISTFIGSSTHWIYKISVSSIFQRNGRQVLQHFTDMIFSWIHTLDTYLDMTGFGKGVVFVSGHNLGRFWEVGPTTSLYVPHGFLKEGANSLIVFETEGRYQETLELVQQPTFKEVKGKIYDYCRMPY